MKQMGMTVILGLLGGLALFLYGMQMTSSGLEAAAGAKMKILLERLTANRFMGVLVASHDHQLIQTVCNRVFDFTTDGKLIDRKTTYDDYLNSQKEQG